MHTHAYAVNAGDYATLNRLWDYCQNSGLDIPMYRSRLSASWISWVVLVPDTAQGSLLLLQFSDILTSLS